MKRVLLSLVFAVAAIGGLTAATIKGVVIDSTSGETIIGATIKLKDNPAVAVVSDIDGRFSINVKDNGQAQRDILVSYVGFQEETIPFTIDQTEEVSVTMKPEDFVMSDVVVVGRRKTDSEASILTSTKLSTSVTVGISAAQIKKGADSDAGEVVRRIPGISLIDGQYIIVRGLTQRYNNVWINGGVAPSSEADGRAFSFDIIPSGSIDNIMIAKSYSADLPGDFSGGFIKITTSGMPKENSFKVGVGTGFNTKTQFNPFTMGAASNTDWLGFDNSMRPFDSSFPSNLDNVTSAEQITHYSKTGFNNDWSTKTSTPLPDLKLNLAWDLALSKRLGSTAALNYSNENRSSLDIMNNRYGVYDAANDQPVVEKEYHDSQYTNEAKISALYNWFFLINSRNNLEFRNTFSLIGQNKYTERYGASLVSGNYYEQQLEYYYSSRLTYTGQLSGNHKLEANESSRIDWGLNYSFASEEEPDRRIVSNIGDYPSDGVLTPDIDTYTDNINRYYQQLKDNVFSGSFNYTKEFKQASIKPTLKTGLYSEYRDRSYQPREFTYRYENLAYEDRLPYLSLPIEEMMDPSWMDYANGVYIDETTTKSNAYTANSSTSAAYATVTIPIQNFTIDAGVRAEYWLMNMSYDKSLTASKVSMVENKYEELSILPALNLSYTLNQKNVFRASYGRTVNRPEFREVSGAIYYDFDLFAEIAGNPDLEVATIDNVDLRYEFYPSAGETLSAGLFYKHFLNPIEWTFTDMGGTYRYNYENAKSAYVAGLEIDIRKNFDFVGVPELSMLLNASAVLSKVQFNEGSLVTEKDRALQGQSPYTVNAGFTYDASDTKLGLSASIMYNVIGKRIMGIGKAVSTSTSDYDVPDSYEMPRHLVDVSLAKSIGKRVEIKLTAKDILAQPVKYVQYPTITNADGSQETREQTTYEYTPGTTISVGVSVKL